MKKTTLAFALLFLGIVYIGHAQNNSEDYVEFNDRKNIVHGVYLGITTHYGQIDDRSTYLGSLKVAYVANQQFEVGFVGTFFYSDQNIVNFGLSRREDLIGGYGGLHLEPILFSKSVVNLSFPLLIGAGGAGFIDSDFDEDYFEDDFDYEGVDAFFVVEPGVNLLFNVSRYLQLEAGVKYRFTSDVDLVPDALSNLNGFSAGIGVKVGVFNLGRNRYKKNI